MNETPASLLAHYASGATTLARLWHIVRTDGQIFAFTDHDEPLTRAGVTYTPNSAFDVSAIASKADMSVDNVELQGLIAGNGITAQDIEAGLWDTALVTLYEVNYNDPEPARIVRYGEIGEIQRKPGMYVAELRGLNQKLQNVIGRVVRASCDAVLGDDRCKVDLEALRVSGTVTATVSVRNFTAASLVQATDWFTFGKVTWTTGANASRKMEIKQHAAGGVIELQLDMASPIAVGDTFTVTPGCNKVGRSTANTGTVTGVTSRTVFTATVAATTAGTYNGGQLTWVSGANAGTVSTVTTQADAGAFTLTGAVPNDIQTGDKFSVLATADMTSTTVGDCTHKYHNLLNFRGFEDVPGQDKLYRYGGQ